MNVTVFGATGAIGSLTVAELLEHGHSVTAYARNPQKVPTEWATLGNRVRVVIGQLSDAAVIDEAITGADAVVSALGPSMDRKARGLPLVEGTQHILDSMKRHGVTRYIGHGTPSVADPREKATFQTRLVGFMGRTFLPRAYKELLAMSRLIMSSGVTWTIVRFTAPKDGAKKATADGSGLRIGFYGTDKIGFPVTRADIAAFTAAQVDDDTYANRAPAISN
jgi:putative NADH-flavin reductase